MTTGTLAAAAPMAGSGCLAAMAGSEAATAAKIAAMPHTASAAALTRVRSGRVVMEGTFLGVVS